jgi:hypothetical protein
MDREADIFELFEEAEPTRNRFVMADGRPLVVEAGLSTMRVFDRNQDGLADLLLGSMGDCFEEKEGGGVEVRLNSGKRGAPAFGKTITLVGRSRKGHTELVRPDSGLYLDDDDIDNDGDPDLIVGAYSHWQPPSRTLDDQEEAEAAKLRARIKEVQEKQRANVREIEKAPEGLGEKEAHAKREELREARQSESSALRKEIESLCRP